VISGPGFARDSLEACRVFASPNHGDRRGVDHPDCIILHYTGMASADAALAWLANPASQVSCHYFVFESGETVQMVPEARRAWHAGVSSWRETTDLNSHSIGIEIANRGHDLSASPPRPHEYPAFPARQIAATIRLVADIKARHRIADARILAHSDIAPGRKVDPGERFPWAKLAAAGLGLWPDAAARRRAARRRQPRLGPGDTGPAVAAMQSALAAFGYALPPTGYYDQRTIDVVSAFQRHWRQACVDGCFDAETAAILASIA
jgi:N-acetylmuramoyl-L-alanine amidase